MSEIEKMFIKCTACGRNGARVIYNGKFFCDDCANAFDTCVMCDHGQKCEFESNPAPIPKVVAKHIRQQTPNGYIEQIAHFPNAQRIKAFCVEGECKCMDYVDEKPKCMRQFGCCEKYKEHEF